MRQLDRCKAERAHHCRVTTDSVWWARRRERLCPPYDLLPQTRRGERAQQFCTLTPTIATVDAVLLPGRLESSQSRRSVPLTHRLRFIL